MIALNTSAAQHIRHANRLVGQRVRYFRRLRGMTQKDLANALSITPQQVQKYEQGLNRISAGLLGILSRVLERDLADFYDAPQHQGFSLHQDATTLEILHRLQTLPPVARDGILSLLTALQKSMLSSTGNRP